MITYNKHIIKVQDSHAYNLKIANFEFLKNHTLRRQSSKLKNNSKYISCRKFQK